MGWSPLYASCPKSWGKLWKCRAETRRHRSRKGGYAADSDLARRALDFAESGAEGEDELGLGDLALLKFQVEAEGLGLR